MNYQPKAFVMQEICCRRQRRKRLSIAIGLDHQITGFGKFIDTVLIIDNPDGRSFASNPTIRKEAGLVILRLSQLASADSGAN